MTVPIDRQGAVGEFITSDGAVLRYRRWPPPHEPRGFIVALHGIQSHSGWYGWSSSRLATAGYDVRFLDRRGAGLNETDRGHAESATRLMDDVAEYLTSVAAHRDVTCADAPVLLSAVSWGAKLAASIAAARGDLIDGLLLLAPAIRTQIEPRWWQAGAIRAATRLGGGRQMADVPLNDPELFTDDPEWQEFIRHDPLALHRVSLSFLNATLDLTQLACAAASQIACPTLVLLAGRDEIVDTAAMRDWAAGLDSQKRTVIEYPDARHTLEFDSGREMFVGDLLEWIESHHGG